MASAIPAVIGLGSSIIGGIRGKGAEKQQRQLAEQFLQMNRPFLQNQMDVSNMSVDAISRHLNPLLFSLMQGGDDADKLGDKFIGQYDSLLGDATGVADEMSGTGRNLLNASMPYLKGAAGALSDLQKFYRPFMFEGPRAIERYLPSARQVNEMMAPEYGNINQGYQAASNRLATMAPRGGGRISSLIGADMDRQKQLSDAFFTGRRDLGDKTLGAAFQGAQGQQAVAGGLQALGLGQGSLGLNTIGTGSNYLAQRGGLAQNLLGLGLSAKNLGLGNKQASSGMLQNLLGVPSSAGQTSANLFNSQANRVAYPQQSNQKGIGGYLVDLFSNNKLQNSINDLLGLGGNKPVQLPNVSNNPILPKPGGFQ